MMQDKENVSIIIATHNDAKTITRALESVTKGIRPANKVTVADNDSKDGCYDVLCKLLGAKEVEVDGRKGLPPEFQGELNGTPVKIFRKRLTTIGHTLNVAMQMNWQGVSIFGFLHGKSWYAPDKIIQSIIAFQSHQSIACVVSDFDNHHPDGRVERIFRPSFDMHRLLLEYPYDRNFLVRSTIFPKLKNGFNEQIPDGYDYDLMLRISEIGLIYHIPAPLHNNTVEILSETEERSISESTAIVKRITAERRGSL